MKPSINEIAPRVARVIAPGDGMYTPGRDQQYFAVGQSAIENILRSLQVSGRRATDVKMVLDYACGYGRVLRWLKAAFPSAQIFGVDADRAAVSSAAEVLGIETSVLDISLAAPPSDPTNTT